VKWGGYERRRRKEGREWDTGWMGYHGNNQTAHSRSAFVIATLTCRIFLRRIYFLSGTSLENERSGNFAGNQKDNEYNKMKGGVCHKGNESSNTMDDGS